MCDRRSRKQVCTGLRRSGQSSDRVMNASLDDAQHHQFSKPAECRIYKNKDLERHVRRVAVVNGARGVWRLWKSCLSLFSASWDLPLTQADMDQMPTRTTRPIIPLAYDEIGNDSWDGLARLNLSWNLRQAYATSWSTAARAGMQIVHLLRAAVYRFIPLDPWMPMGLSHVGWREMHIKIHYSLKGTANRACQSLGGDLGYDETPYWITKPT